MSGTVKERLVALALAKMQPMSLRLGLLEMAGMSTKEALDELGLPRSNRYRVIAGLRACGIDEPRPVREAVLLHRGTVPSKKVSYQRYAEEKGLSGDWSRARLYGMEPQAMHAIYLKQDGRCYLCWDALPPDLRKIHIEHDHSCCPSPKNGLGGGQISCGTCVRGLACSSCNRLIGIARDDPHRLRRIADNLEAANHRVATARLKKRWLAGTEDERAS